MASTNELSSLTLGRLNEQTTPNRCRVDSMVAPFIALQKMQAQEFMNIYHHQRMLFKETIGAFVESFTKGKENLLPKFARAIIA